ncbi:MAG: hypothetical protein LPJ89_01020, partial [Hymenobacteraceae bacterium]|nr:hypothetical protein [Hymenobacteraceae bacterium]
IPNWMLRSPKYANTVAWLESERQKGISAYQKGGFTAQNSSLGESSTQPDLMPVLIMEVRRLHDVIEGWPNKLQVYNNVVDAAEKLQTYNDLKDSSGV